MHIQKRGKKILPLHRSYKETVRQADRQIDRDTERARERAFLTACQTLSQQRCFCCALAVVLFCESYSTLWLSPSRHAHSHFSFVSHSSLSLSLVSSNIGHLSIDENGEPHANEIHSKCKNNKREKLACDHRLCTVLLLDPATNRFDSHRMQYFRFALYPFSTSIVICCFFAFFSFIFFIFVHPIDNRSIKRPSASASKKQNKNKVKSISFNPRATSFELLAVLCLLQSNAFNSI